MTGKIMKGIGGFYYVYVEGSGLYECRAKGVFRNRREKPCVGDWVDIDVISQKDHTGNLVKIHSRKNRLIRPLAANVDQALVIFAVHEPEPDYHLLNRFLIMMERQHIPVVIGFNKMDLAQKDEEAFLKKAYEKSGCQLLFLSAAEEKGIEELKEIKYYSDSLNLREIITSSFEYTNFIESIDMDVDSFIDNINGNYKEDDNISNILTSKIIPVIQNILMYNFIITDWH